MIFLAVFIESLLLMAAVLVPTGYLFGFFKRKFQADCQARVGPSFAGPSGFAQGAFDFLKLMKRAPVVQLAFRDYFILSVCFVLLLSMLPSTPLLRSRIRGDFEFEVFWLLAAEFAAAFSLSFLGFQSPHAKIRVVAGRLLWQLVPALVSGLFCISALGVITGGYSWSAFLDYQGFGLNHWILFHSPWSLCLYVCFFGGALILSLAHPFDALVEEFFSVSGRAVAAVTASRFYLLFVWQTVGAVLFLGGGAIPVGLDTFLRARGWEGVVWFFELAILMLKVWAELAVVVVISQVTSKTRSDQIVSLVWKYLLPITLIMSLGLLFEAFIR